MAFSISILHQVPRITRGKISIKFARHEIEAITHSANFEFKMAANNISDGIIKMLSSDVDKAFKDIELKYWGVLPWDAIADKLAVQDFFRKLSNAKKKAMIAHSSGYTNEEKLASTSFAGLHGMACSELSFWTKSILRRLFFTVKHSHPWIIVYQSKIIVYKSKNI